MVLFWTSKADFSSRLSGLWSYQNALTKLYLVLKTKNEIKNSAFMNHLICWKQFSTGWVGWATQHLAGQDMHEDPGSRLYNCSHSRSCHLCSHSTHPSFRPGCPWRRHSDPKTCLPFCDASSKLTSMLPPSLYIYKTKVLVWVSGWFQRTSAWLHRAARRSFGWGANCLQSTKDVLQEKEWALLFCQHNAKELMGMFS